MADDVRESRREVRTMSCESLGGACYLIVSTSLEYPRDLMLST